jgi:hypothetical protein
VKLECPNIQTAVTNSINSTMPTEYQYSAPPQPLKPNKKYRPENEDTTGSVPLNMLSDPRVIKGNTHALARQMAITKQQSTAGLETTQQANNNTLGGSLPNAPMNTQVAGAGAGAGGKTKKAKAPPNLNSIPSMPFYEFNVRGYVSGDMSLEPYLVEQDYAPITNSEVETQTDVFNPRPPTPDFIPRKTGIDVHTQVEDVNELFKFDEEVKPLVAVIVGKTIEQALFEVKAEMELLALEEDAQMYHRIKKVEEDWVKDKLKETRDEVENKAKGSYLFVFVLLVIAGVLNILCTCRSTQTTTRRDQQADQAQDIGCGVTNYASNNTIHVG